MAVVGEGGIRDYGATSVPLFFSFRYRALRRAGHGRLLNLD